MGTPNGVFGSHLRQLRTERGLTLDQVEESSVAHGVQISPAYLSRCENGLLRPNLDRLSILSKLYNVNLGMLVERHESEQQKQFLAGAELDAAGYDELYAIGVEQAHHGNLKSAFITFSAAHDRAVSEGGTDACERAAAARLSLVFVLAQQDRHELASQQAGEILKTRALQPLMVARTLVQLANCQYRARRLHFSRIIVEGVGERLNHLPPKEQGDYHQISGLLEGEFGQHVTAVRKSLRAAAIYRAAKDRNSEAKALCTVGRAWRALGKLDRAIECLQASLDIARRSEFKLQEAGASLELAKTYLQAGAPPETRLLIQNAMELAREGDYPDLLFFAYVLGLDLAVREKNAGLRNSLYRAAGRMIRQIRTTNEHLPEFRRLAEQCH